MADVKIDEARAKSWTKEVLAKLDAVERTLKDVRELSTKVDGEEDSIFQMINKAANMMDETWTATENAFKKGWKALEEGLDTFRKAGEKVKSSFEELESNI